MLGQGKPGAFGWGRPAQRQWRQRPQQCRLNPESGCTGSHEPWTTTRGSQQIHFLFRIKNSVAHNETIPDRYSRAQRG